MSRLWTFGDSFTDGCGCRPGDEFYEKYSEERGKVWPEHLASKLNLELKNYGIPSASNFVIHYTFLRFLDAFRDGDTVIVGLSDPTRLGFYTEHTDNPKSFSIASVDQEYETSPFKEVMDKSEFKSLQDYSKYSHTRYEDKWNRHYTEMFIYLLRYLEKNGIKTLLWDHTEWTKHSQIMNFTKGQVHDRHWSFEGHYTFYKQVLRNIGQGEII